MGSHNQDFNASMGPRSKHLGSELEANPPFLANGSPGHNTEKDHRMI